MVDTSKLKKRKCCGQMRKQKTYLTQHMPKHFWSQNPLLMKDLEKPAECVPGSDICLAFWFLIQLHHLKN